MSGHLEASQILDLIRRPDGDEGASRHLMECLECRGDMVAMEALRALALEGAPQPPPALAENTLDTCNQESLREQLADQQGDEIARQVLAPVASHGASETRWALWTVLFLLLALVGGGWWYARVSSTQLTYEPKPLLPEDGGLPPLEEETPVTAPAPPAKGNSPKFRDAPVSVPTPEPGARQTRQARDAEVDRAVKKLMKAHLHEAQAKKRPKKRKATPRPTNTPPATRVPARAATKVPTARPTPVPTRVPTPIPTRVPTARPKPTALPTPVPTPMPTRALPPLRASTDAAAISAPDTFSLSSDGPAPESEGHPPATPSSAGQVMTLDRDHLSLGAAETATLTLRVPAQSPLDIRLFSPRGATVRLLHDGPAKAGLARYVLDGKDGQGRPLSPGSYYLRVLSPYVSRVEALEILP